MRKKRILVMTDSPRIYTGFANIGRHVAGYLHDTGRWEVHYLGWFDTRGNEGVADFPYPIYTTMVGQNGRPMPEDSYAFRTFPPVANKVRPDVVWVVSDSWMAPAPVTWGYEDQATRPYRAVLYTPIDGDPIPTKTMHGGGPQGNFELDWAEQFRRYDTVVGYGQYGLEEVNKLCGSEVCKDYIHHGVDTNVYHPLPREEQLRIKREVFGLGEDDFLTITVARNQPRKLYPAMIKALRIFIDKYEGGRKVYSYYHAPLNDPVGWNLPDLIGKAGLSHRLVGQPGDVGHRIILNDKLGVGVGPTDEELNEYFNAADLGLFVYSSEGWGLPPMECMAAGTPTIMTKYSAPIDWAEGATHWVEPTSVYPEPRTNFMRAQVAPGPIATAMRDMYKDKDLRGKLRRTGIQLGIDHDWDKVILPQWDALLDGLELKPQEREVIHLSDADSITMEGEAAPTSPKVSIIIPTHQGGNMFRQCIDSIHNSGYDNYELIVVDHGNWTRDCKEYIKYLVNTGIKVLKWGSKYNPARVLNMAAREATGEYILFMDNDTIAQVGFIDRILECFSQNKCGAATLRLVHPKTGQYVLGLDYDSRLSFSPSSLGEGICEKAALSGSCMMVPRALFVELGGFDEDYHFFWQDVDFCCKLRKRGHLCYCNTNAHIFHVGGVTRRYLSRATHTIDHMRLTRKWWGEYVPRTTNGDKEAVAIIKLLTMGDAVIVTPLLPLIRSKHPDAHIVLYTLKEYSDLFADNPSIDEVKVVGPLDKGDFGPNWGLMAYDSIIFNTLISEEWDYCYPCNQLDYWMEYRRAGVTMSQTYADMFGFTLPDQRYRIYPDSRNRTVAKGLIDSYPGNGPIIVMHTTAGWSLKEWTPDKFNELVTRLWEGYQARVFVVGGPEEKLESIYVRNVGGLLSLRDIVALCEEADLYIGGDSGPMHLAMASHEGRGCPILSFFGCTNPEVIGWGEIDNYITVQSPYAGIVNCGFSECPMEKMAAEQDKTYTHCSVRLSVDDMYAAASALLDRGEDTVQEHRKGGNRCLIRFKDFEWYTTLLEGEDPEDVCSYGVDLVDPDPLPEVSQ